MLGRAVVCRALPLDISFHLSPSGTRSPRRRHLSHRAPTRLRRGITPEVYRYHRPKPVPQNVPFFPEDMVKMCYMAVTARDRKSRGYRQLLAAQEVMVLGESRS